MEDARCPKCGEKIAYLDIYSEEIIHYLFSHDGYEEVNKEGMGSDGMYYCPECGECVAKTEIEARKILFQE